MMRDVLTQVIATMVFAVCTLVLLHAQTSAEYSRDSDRKLLSSTRDHVCDAFSCAGHAVCPGRLASAFIAVPQRHAASTAKLLAPHWRLW